MDVIEDFLAVIGLISLVLTVVRVIWVFFGAGTEWIDNVNITERPYNEDDEDLDSGSGIYPTYFKNDRDEPSEFLTATMFTPQSTIIRNLKIKRIDDASIETGKLKYRTVKTVKTITPQFPLCVVCARGEAIAKYCIEWRIDYGEKASYYFYDNMRNGNNDRMGIEYRAGFLSKIRKLLDLK